MNSNRHILLIAQATAAPAFPVLAAGPVTADARGVAIRGQDPVACFVDGKLYLNLSPAVQKRWQADIPGFIDRAYQNWPGLKGP